MASEKGSEDKDTGGLKGLAKRIFGLGGGSGCCEEMKIVEVDEDEEKADTSKEAE
jgi:hypothetical protein